MTVQRNKKVGKCGSPKVSGQKRRLTFSSVYSGIGGFVSGFKKAGMKCKFVCESDETARDSFLRNHSDTLPLTVGGG